MNGFYTHTREGESQSLNGEIEKAKKMPKSSSPNGDAQDVSNKSATTDAAEFNEPPPNSLAFADWQLLDKSGKAELYKVASQRFAMRQLVGQEYYYKFYKYSKNPEESFFELINGLKMSDWAIWNKKDLPQDAQTVENSAKPKATEYQNSKSFFEGIKRIPEKANAEQANQEKKIDRKSVV